MRIDKTSDASWAVHFGPDEDPVEDHLRVLLEAMDIYVERQKKYGQNWRRKGWRGALFAGRLALERAWDALWGAEVPGYRAPGSSSLHDVDDLLDTINYAAMAIRLVREGDRDGEWGYPPEHGECQGNVVRCPSRYRPRQTPGLAEEVVQCKLPAHHAEKPSASHDGRTYHLGNVLAGHEVVWPTEEEIK